jgi:hypothetical protein
VKRFPHRWLLVFSLLSTGFLAASFGLCTKPWQILFIRAVTGAVNMGSYVGNIVLGQMVDDQSKRQGKSDISHGPQCSADFKPSPGFKLVTSSVPWVEQLSVGTWPSQLVECQSWGTSGTFKTTHTLCRARYCLVWRYWPPLPC